MAERTNRDLVDLYFRSLNSADYDGLAEAFHPDIDMHPTGSRPRLGRDDALDFFPNVFEMFPEHYDDPVRVIDAGETIVVEIVFDGTTADGRTVHFEAVDVFDFADGHIKRLRQWFDTSALARQLQA